MPKYITGLLGMSFPSEVIGYSEHQIFRSEVGVIMQVKSARALDKASRLLPRTRGLFIPSCL
jgi:hypothetical protein